MRVQTSLLIPLALMACQPNEDLQLEARQYSGAACEACPSVEISVLEALGEDPLDASINAAQREEIISLLDYDQEIDASDIPEAIESFQAAFRRVQEEFPEELTGWEATARTDLGYYDSHVVSLKMDTYVFTGGAHGLGNTRYLNFNRRTGKELDALEFFADPKAFSEFAETSFRRQYAIPAGEPINSTGFMFEEDRFALPQNIGIEAGEVVLHYNPYEAASYAEGPLILRFPLAEVRPYLAWAE